MHLYFARFVNYFLHDIGAVDFEEPFKQIIIQGALLAKTYKDSVNNEYLSASDVDFSEMDNLRSKLTQNKVNCLSEKMSKSKLNGVSPVELAESFSQDYLKLYVAFGPNLSKVNEWSDSEFKSVNALMARVWNNVSKVSELVSQTPKINNDIQDGNFESVDTPTLLFRKNLIT